MRVEDWYRSGNLAPVPDCLAGASIPKAELRKLGSALRKGTSRSTRWPQVPYLILGVGARHGAGPELAPVTESPAARSNAFTAALPRQRKACASVVCLQAVEGVAYAVRQHDTFS